MPGNQTSKRWVLLLGFLAAAPVAAQQHAITLGEALQLAAKQDPAVIQAQGTVRSTGVPWLPSRGSRQGMEMTWRTCSACTSS